MSALTFFADSNILNYLYNELDGLDTYDSILIALTDSSGNEYDSGIGVSSSRSGILRNTLQWGFSGNIAYNNLDVEFPINNSGSAKTVVGFNLYISSLGASNPPLIARGTLNSTITIQKGEIPIIRAYDANSGDGITVDIDENNNYNQAFKGKIYQYLFQKIDSLSSVNQYRFMIVDSNGATTPLSVSLSRDNNTISPNWNINTIGSGATGYSQAKNANDLEFQLNEQNTTITTDTLFFYYGEGDFSSPTFTKAGELSLTQDGGETPLTYQIQKGDTPRLKAGQLIINSK